MKEPLKCPHCNGDLGLEVTAKLKAESQMVFRFSPHPGELMTAKNVGGAIEDFGNLLKACGRDAGVPTEVLVERIETSETGEISVHVLIARGHEHAQSTRNKRSRRAAVKQP